MSNEQPKCPYCSKPIQTPVSRKIIDRAWNPTLRKQYVREQLINFCSQDCGGYYQMGCEG